MKNIKTFRKIRSTLLTALAAAALCGTTSYAQTTLVGSAGAGWQTWTTAKDPADPNIYIDLDDDKMPFWDSPWGASGNYGGGNAEKNAGFCMISDGDCQGIGSALFAPGALPFWAMPYDTVNDTGGVRDNKVYFHTTDRLLRATLFLNSSSIPSEINEFGWFETDATGSVIGTRHMLFQGTGDNNGALKPDRIGKTVFFTPTPYFGYYYNDVSEPSPLYDPLNPSAHGYGCYTYTLFEFVEERCLEVTGNQGDHDFVVFKDPRSRNSTFWIGGEDPADCATQDGDCNLTIVKVSN